MKGLIGAMEDLWKEIVLALVLIVVLIVAIGIIPEGTVLLDLTGLCNLTSGPTATVKPTATPTEIQPKLEWLPTKEIWLPTATPTATTVPTATPTPDFWGGVRNCDIDSVLVSQGDGYVQHYLRSSSQAPKTIGEDKVYGKIAVEGLYEIGVKSEVLLANIYGIIGESRMGKPVKLRDPLLCKEPVNRRITWPSDWQLVDNRKVVLDNGNCVRVTLERGIGLTDEQLRTVFYLVRAKDQGTTWLNLSLSLGTFERVFFNDEKELCYLFTNGEDATVVKTQKVIPLNTEMLLTLRNCQDETQHEEVKFFLYQNEVFTYLVEYN